MTSIHANLVANEIDALGFKTTVSNNGVIVSLNKRAVEVMEVKIALGQVSIGVAFKCSWSSNGVMVTW